VRQAAGKEPNVESLPDPARTGNQSPWLLNRLPMRFRRAEAGKPVDACQSHQVGLVPTRELASRLVNRHPASAGPETQGRPVAPE
jgi:hypothetical protein